MVQILDCTLRDGGYNTNWNFSPDFLEDYFKFLKKYPVDIVEVGFRLLNQDKNFGPFAYSIDEFLQGLGVENIAVMVKADELLGQEKRLHELFAEKKNSPVELVRVAVPYQKALQCGKITEILKNKGYKVSLNLTKIFPVVGNEISLIMQGVKDWGTFDILYFADTYGNFLPKDVKNVICAIKTDWNEPIGFHAHNNNANALGNSMIAIKNGIDYLDSTMGGIGRDAGNLKTEDILNIVHLVY